MADDEIADLKCRMGKIVCFLTTLFREVSGMEYSGSMPRRELCPGFEMSTILFLDLHSALERDRCGVKVYRVAHGNRVVRAGAPSYVLKSLHAGCVEVETEGEVGLFGWNVLHTQSRVRGQEIV